MFGVLTVAKDDTAQILQKIQESFMQNNRQDMQNVIGTTYNPFDPSVLTPLKKEQEALQDANKTETVSNLPEHLQAVYQRKKAMIDGKWYKRGDEVKGYRLTAIYGKKVVLLNGGDRLELKLFKDINLKAMN